MCLDILVYQARAPSIWLSRTGVANPNLQLQLKRLLVLFLQIKTCFIASFQDLVRKCFKAADFSKREPEEQTCVTARLVIDSASPPGLG